MALQEDSAGPAGSGRPMEGATPDPFEGYFLQRKHRDPRAGDLLGIAGARRWFDVIAWGQGEGLYGYQQALQGRSGPRASIGGDRLLMLSSYDYLGLIGHPAVEAAARAALETYGTGTGGVRLLTGTTDLHRRLEREIAAFKGTEAAVTFSSGYLANLAVVTALFGPRDLVLLDALAHRSLVDACTLARVPCRRFRHNDPESLEEELRRGPRGKRVLVVAEGAYSMDGDVCPLPDLVALKERHGAFLLVDEAHSFGVLGPTGRGVHERFGMAAASVDLWTGSLSKAIPSNGGFVAGSRALAVYLQHAAAPFVFSSAPCPSAVAAASESLRVIEAEPERHAALERNSRRLRDGLREAGYDTGVSTTPIVPVLLGDDLSAWRLARDLLRRGIHATAVVRPAVGQGAARLRLCATAAHSEEDLREALAAFRVLRPAGAATAAPVR